LLSLACLPTGRWLGLDAVIAWLLGWNPKTDPAEKPVPKVATAKPSNN